MNVLVIEEAVDHNFSLPAHLKQQGFNVFITVWSDSVLQLTRALHPCSVIIDVEDINEGSLCICRSLRENGHVEPILFLSSDHAVAQRVAAMQAGAQDFIAKPFSVEELVARLQTHLLYKPTQSPEQDYIATGRLILNYGTRRVHFGPVHIRLTQREADLMTVLMQHANSPVSRYDLYKQLWKQEDHGSGSSNVVDVYVGYLRAKLTDITRAGGPMITTVRSIGFMLDMGGNPALRLQSPSAPKIPSRDETLTERAVSRRFTTL